MHFTKPVAIFVSSKRVSSMIDAFMVIPPGTQARINTVLICIHQCACNDGVFDERLDGLLLHVGQQMNHALTTALHHPKHGRSLFLQGPSACFAFESAATSLSTLALHHLRLPFMA